MRKHKALSETRSILEHFQSAMVKIDSLSYKYTGSGESIWEQLEHKYNAGTVGRLANPDTFREPFTDPNPMVQKRPADSRPGTPKSKPDEDLAKSGPLPAGTAAEQQQ